MEIVPAIVLTAVGAVGFCLMLAAFGMVGRRGGWQQAMRPDAHGHWPAPRRFMLVGALLGYLFALGMFIPGVIPWWDNSAPYDAWSLGVVFGLGLGFSLTNFYWSFRLARREPPAAGHQLVGR